MNYRKALVFFSLILLFCIIHQYHRNFNLYFSAEEPKSHSWSIGRFSEAGGHGYYVRHCVTDRILGNVPSELQSIPFKISEHNSSENPEERRSSFENIFKNKVWVPQQERKNENQASGNNNI